MTINLDRNLTPTTEATLKNDSQIIAVVVLYLDFANSLHKYFAGSNIDIPVISSIIPSATYVGVGGISSIDAVEEGIELSASGIKAKINGLDSTYLALVLQETYFGRDAKLALVLLDSDYKQLANTEPVLLFQGFMSKLNANIKNGALDIEVEIESILRDWERPRLKRYNSGTQELIDNSDMGFDNVPLIVSKEIVWG